MILLLLLLQKQSLDANQNQKEYFVWWVIVRVGVPAVRFLAGHAYRYLTSARFTYASRRCSRVVLSRGCAIAPAPRLEALQGGSGHQPGAARKLRGSVLFSTLGRREFQDLQPRDVDTALLLACTGMLAGVTALKERRQSDAGSFYLFLQKQSIPVYYRNVSKRTPEARPFCCALRTSAPQHSPTSLVVYTASSTAHPESAVIAATSNAGVMTIKKRPCTKQIESTRSVDFLRSRMMTRT